MNRTSLFRTSRAGLFLLVLSGAAAGCVDEQNVFENRTFFDDPAPAAGGFLGYLQETPGKPVCGNCHAQPAAEWAGTAHAGAWNDLQASGLAEPSCENCHSTNQLGNAATADGGWAATGDARYYDVQCESCHGAGQSHVAQPTVVQPIPSLAVGLDLTDSCGECHQGAHQPFVEQWSLSKHAGVVGFAAARAECAGCHRGQGALLAWGVRAEYAEKDSPDHLPIVCGVCHDPHDATNDGQLRFPVATPSIEVHLCARCHNRRSSPDVSSSHGLEPHAPESELLVGEAGWFPPNVTIDQGQIRGTHGTDRNPKLCATCHVEMYSIEDVATGQITFNSVGHLFEAIPCVDGSGIPVGGDCAYTAQARAFTACAVSGCHGTPEGAAAILQTVSVRISGLANELIGLLTLVDPNLDDAGGEIDAENPTFTVAEGAFFNYSLTLHPDGDVFASTTHNGFLTEALLVASIAAVEDEYGVGAGQAVDRDAQLEEVLRRAGR